LTAEHVGNLQKGEITEQVDDKTYHVEYSDGNDDHLTYEEIINEHTYTFWMLRSLFQTQKVQQVILWELLRMLEIF